MKIDLSVNPSPHSLRNKIGRVLWGIVRATLFQPTPKVLHGWRCFLLRLFGAKIGRGVRVYPSAKIWVPWNLVMGDYSALSHDVDCYCVAPIHIGPHATVSQYSHLCAASHDLSCPHMQLITSPIRVEAGAWVCADVFVGPGVTIGEGAVAVARAVVVRDVEPWSVVGGNPARFIKKRELRMEKAA